MDISIPLPRYLTFRELQERWGCSPDSIREVVCTGALVPSFHSKGEFKWVEWVPDESRIGSDRLVPVLRGHSRDLHEWLYLRCPFEIGPRQCKFDVLSTSATDPPEHDDRGMPPVAFWYYLDDKPDFSAIEGHVVFMVSEVERFESAHKRSNETRSAESKVAPLGTRERNTLLALVHVLARMADIPLSNPSKASEMIASKAATLGIDLADRTVADKLKQCSAAIAARSK